MNFKKLFSIAALAATVAALPAGAQTWSRLIDTDTSEDFGANGASSDVYFGVTETMTNSHTITAETLNNLEYRSGRKNKNKVKHKYLRIGYNIPGVTSFGDHKINLFFRWAAPTSTADQLAGSFGTFAFKPSISGAFGPVTYKFVPAVSIYLQRQRAQRNQKIGPTGTAAANTLYNPNQELIVGVPLGVKNLAFNIDIVNANPYYGKANGADGYWAGNFTQDYEVRYAIDSLDGLEVALATTNETWYHKDPTGAKPGKPDNEFKFGTKSTYNLRLTKAF